MRIKTFIASSAQEALYKVKSDMGKDAIILHTKQIKQGGFLGLFAKNMVEVTAATDISIAPKPITKPRLMPLTETSPVEAKASDDEIDVLKAELSEVKDMVKNIVANSKDQGTEWNNDLMPSFRNIYNRLLSMEVSREIIDAVVDGALKSLSDQEVYDEQKVEDAIKHQLISVVDVAKPIELEKNRGRIVVFIGPTGVGKTTTIAKLAAKFVLYANKKVGLITTDTFKVGSIEQLKMYGDLLEAPVKVAHRAEDMKQIVDNFQGYDLVLIDTMGFSPNNKMQVKQVKGFLEGIDPSEIHMVVSAATKTVDTEEMLKTYRELHYNRLIITKVDETRTHGVILNAKKVSNCNLSYITTGQNVPDDIEIASSSKIADLLLGRKDV